MSRKCRKLQHPPKVSPPYKIDTIEDLLDLAWRCEENEFFDWFTLWKLIPSLTKLSKMVGMTELKSKIVDQVIYYIQELNKGEFPENLHTVIYGPPGVGKTTVAKILAEIYGNLGILSSGHVIVTGREDFVGKWVGHTEPKTITLLQQAVGGVLFIDEVYSLGYSSCKGNPDSFSKSAIDILNRFLSERQGDFICIIAGYEKDIEDHFFSVNRGLQRRFPIRYKIEGYSPKELYQMFCLVAKENGWKLENSGKRLFEKNKSLFSFYGGDMKVLLDFCGKAYARRVFGKRSSKKLLTKEDLKKGIKAFSGTRKVKDQEIVNRYIS